MLFAVALGVLLVVPGALAGALTAELIMRRALRTEEPVVPVVDDELPISAAVDDRIDAVAASWARSHDWAEAEELVANKLRLAYRLRRRRTDPSDRGSW